MKEGLIVELTIQSVSKTFGEKEVLRNINISAKSGKALGLLGRNGAGKTTTIRIIMGVFFPDSGEILVDGKPIDRNNIRIGYLPEERGLYPKKIISEQLIYLAKLRGMTTKDAKQSCDKWLDRMSMSEYKNKKLETLSKGNQQKIQLAATLMCDPDIVILDEPFSGLDPVNAMLLKDVIKEMIDNGSVVLFSSHQMNYIEEFCDSIAIINGGKIVLEGRISEIKHNYPRDTILISSKQYQDISPFITKNLSSCINSVNISRDEDETIIVKLKDENFKKRLIKELSENDFDIDCIKVREPSLNDIFVEYTEVGV